MLIEKDAKRFIFKAIELEQQLKSQETLEKLKGNIVIKNAAYDKTRKNLVEIICQINAVSNCEGKGRDDLEYDILLAAEEKLRKISDSKSKAVRKLASGVKESFTKLRQLFRKYSECVDAVDPQLRNNADLVEALVAFEKSWGKGKDFFTNDLIFDMLVSFSELIESLSEKHIEIKEKLESMDSDIFLIIPSIAILKSLDNENKAIYMFCTSDSHYSLFDNLEERYKNMKEKIEETKIYNLLENLLIGKNLEKSYINSLGFESQNIDNFVNEIKKAAIILQRSRPADWNFFMETAMGII